MLVIVIRLKKVPYLFSRILTLRFILTNSYP